MTYRFTVSPSCTRITRERAEGRCGASLQGPSKLMPAKWKPTRQVCAAVTVGSSLTGDNHSVYVLSRGLGPDVSPLLSPATPPVPLLLPTPRPLPPSQPPGIAATFVEFGWKGNIFLERHLYSRSSYLHLI